MPVWNTVLRRDPCAYCGIARSGTVDHIVPKSKGGANHWSNLSGACHTCNNGKADTSLLRFLLHVAEGGVLETQPHGGRFA